MTLSDLTEKGLRIMVLENISGSFEKIEPLLKQDTQDLQKLQKIDYEGGFPESLNPANWDLIILTFNCEDLRNEDGLEELPPQYESIPKIILTDNPDRNIAERVFEDGIQDYLPMESITSGWLGNSIQNAIYRQSRQNKLRNDQEMLRELSETIHYGIWITDGNYDRFLYTNETFDRIFQFSKDNPKKKLDELFQKIHPDDREKTSKLIRELKNGGQIDDEYRYERSDGEIRWIWVKAYAITDDTGTVKQIMGVNSDITERKHMEQNLKQTKRRFHQFSESVNEGFCLMSSDRSNVILVNSAFTEILGRSVNELEDKAGQFIEFVHPEDRDKFRSGIDSYGSIPDHADDKPIRDVKVRMCQPGGDVRWILHREFPVYDEEGSLFRVAVIIKDVTPFHEAHEEKEKTRRRFKELIQNIDDVVYLANADYTETIFVSSAFEDIWGKSLDSIEANPWNLVNSIYKADREDVLAHKENWLAAPDSKSFSMEYRIERPDGDKRWIREEMYRIFEDNEFVRIAGTARDVTEQRELREQLEDSLERSEVLLKEVHHRVKNNLQIVLGLLGLQMRKVDDNKASRALEDSRNRINSMAMIHQKLYEGKGLKNIDFSDYINDLIEHILNSKAAAELTIHTEIQIKNIKIDIDTAIPCGLIINELLTNSLKHAFKNRKSGLIQLHFHSIEDNYELIISDNGSGIDSPETLLNKESLGIRLVKNLAKNQLNGKIDITSEDGMTFTITIPKESVS